MTERYGYPPPKLYEELASWWPLLSAPEDYAEEAALFERVLIESCASEPSTLLELGSGGGNNASHLKARFRITLTDVSEPMLEVSRALNPECEHFQGDMRTLSLGRRFDAVFVHDAVGYLATESDLRRALATAYEHLKPGGAVVLVPDDTKENFRPSTSHGGHDGDGRGLRYLEWSFDPDPGDDTFVVDYAFLLRERDGSVRVVHDRHVNGLFSRESWLRWLSAAGFVPSSRPFEHSELEDGECEIFVGRKPSPAR